MHVPFAESLLNPNHCHIRGGKANAPSIRDDLEFQNAIDQLQQSWRTVTAVFISFDLDQMEPYRSRAAVIDPRISGWSGLELHHGTHVCIDFIKECLTCNLLLQVPRPDLFDNDAQLHGGHIMDIKEEWKCEEHDGTCYHKDKACQDGPHFVVNWWRLKGWASTIVCVKPLSSFLSILNVSRPRMPHFLMEVLFCLVFHLLAYSKMVMLNHLINHTDAVVLATTPLIPSLQAIHLLFCLQFSHFSLS